MNSLETELSAREVSLLASAYRVITQQGTHRTSLQDIAEDAGVSRGLLLYYFSSKDQLLLTTMRWALLRTADRIRDRLARVDSDARHAVSALVDAVFVGPEQNRDFYLFYLDFVEYATRAPSFGGLAKTTHEIINGLYAEIIREGAFVVDDVDGAAATVRAYIDGTFVTWLQEDRWREDYPQVRQRCFVGLLRLLGVD